MTKGVPTLALNLYRTALRVLEPCALGDNNDTEILAVFVPALYDATNLLDGNRVLRDQNHVGATRHARLERDPPGMPSHHFDDDDAVVRFGGRVQPVDRFGRD